MREQAGNQVRRNVQNLHATGKDFVKVFSDPNGLYQLSFLLTGDREKAKKCLVAGIEDCVKQNLAFRLWARSWAKRIIAENAIRALKTRSRLPNSSTSAAVFCPSEASSVSGGPFNVNAMLRLGEFERFVFVMCVLERHSHHECVSGVRFWRFGKVAFMLLKCWPGPARRFRSCRSSRS